LWNVLELRSDTEIVNKALLKNILKIFKAHRETKNTLKTTNGYKALQLPASMLRRPEINELLSDNPPDAIYVGDFYSSYDELRSWGERIPVPIYVKFVDLEQEAQFAGTDRDFMHTLSDDHQIYPDIFSIIPENFEEVSKWIKMTKTYKAKLVDIFFQRLIKNQQMRDRPAEQARGVWYGSFEADQENWRRITSMSIAKLQTKSPEEWLREKH
jgi:hypothetical protein